jgi:hypothetical protein
VLVTRVRTAVEPGESGAAIGLDLGPADAGGEASLTESLREAASLLDVQQSAERIVVAVPDLWLDGGADGARRREVVRRVLADERGLPLLAIIGRSQALVASQAGADGAVGGDQPYTVTAGHLDDDALAFGRCDVASAGAVPTVVLTGCRQDDQAASRVAGFGAVLTEALQTRLADDPASAAAALDGAPAALLAELGARRKRLRAALSASASNRLFRTVPVVGLLGTPPAQWVTAGEVEAAFDPVAATLTSAIRAFQAAAGPVRDVRLVLTGSAAANPLVVELVWQEFAERLEPTPGAVIVADDLAPARGAARVAGGRVTAELPLASPVRLPVHRIAGGRLVDGSIDLPASCYQPAGTETVLVSARSSPPAVLGDVIVPPGSYRARLWPGLAGPVLALRPPGDAPAILISLPAGRERN